MLGFNSIMIGTPDPKALGEFYSKVLEKKSDMQEEGWMGFKVGGTFLTIGHHDKVKGMATQPERVILNFETTEVKEHFERIKKLGAKVIAEPYSYKDDDGKDFAWIATFADPDGNYFQLMTPWEG